MRIAMHFRIDAPNGKGLAPCPQGGAVKRLTRDVNAVDCRACRKTDAFKAAARAQEAPAPDPELPADIAELAGFADALEAAIPPVTPAPSEPETVTIPRSELAALLHFAQSASVLSSGVKKLIPPDVNWRTKGSITPAQLRALRADAELIETRGDVAILRALHALGVSIPGIDNGYADAIATAQGRADAAQDAAMEAITAAHARELALIPIRDALGAVRAWAESTRRTAIHYGIENLITGADAVLKTDAARPGQAFNCDADLNSFLPRAS